MVGLNLLLNFTLIWPMAEAGLAVSTSIAAAVQLVVLTAIFSRRQAPLGWRQLVATTARTVLATLVMAGVVYGALQWMPAGARLTDQLMRVVRADRLRRGGLLRNLPVAGRTRIGYAGEWERRR